MARTLCVQDAERCTDLLGECTDLWLDAQSWQVRALEGITGLIGGCIGAFAISRIENGVPSMLDARVSNGDLNIVRSFADYLREGGLRLLPEARAIVPAIFRDNGITYVQSDLVKRNAYHQSVFYQRFMQPDRIEDALSSVALNADNFVVGLSISRCGGDKPFSEREQALLELFNRLLASRVGKPLAASYHVSADTLSPRLRDTLQALIEGNTQKQLAKRLRISPATAHEYVALVYKHFGVRGRPDLMAYLLKRRPKLLVSSLQMPHGAATRALASH